MFLMGRPVERETHETQSADDQAIHLVQEPALAEVTVGRLVKSNERPVHEVANQ